MDLFKFEENEILEKNLVDLLIKIRRVILDKPLQYFKGVKGKNEEVFSLFDIGVKGLTSQNYEDLRRSAMDWSRVNGDNYEMPYNNLENLEYAFLVITDETYHNLYDNRQILKDLVQFQWIKFSANLIDDNHHELGRFVWGLLKSG